MKEKDKEMLLLELDSLKNKCLENRLEIEKVRATIQESRKPIPFILWLLPKKYMCRYFE